jgi:hypothetical protein
VSCFLLLLGTKPAETRSLFQSDTLKVVVVQGQDTITMLRERSTTEIIVEIRDEDDRRVPGAIVVFSLPAIGPSAVFANGAKITTVVADAQGRASVVGLRANDVAGRYQIRVNASFQGKSGRAVIDQNNKKKEWISSKKLLILGAVAAAVVIVCCRPGPTPRPPEATISVAGGSVGKP